MRNQLMCLTMLLVGLAGCGKDTGTTPVPDTGHDLGAADAASGDGGEDVRGDAAVDQPDTGSVDAGDVSLDLGDMGADLGQGPDISLTFPFSRVTVFEDDITVRGTANGADSITVNGTPVESDDGLSTWTATVSLLPWDNMIEVVATTSEGATSTLSRLVRRDATVTSSRTMVTDSAAKMAWYLLPSIGEIVEVRLEPRSRRLVASYPQMGVSTQNTLAYDPVRQKLYGCRDSNRVDEIDIATGAIIDFEVIAGCSSLVFVGSTVYVHIRNAIVALDPLSGEVTHLSGSYGGDERGTGPALPVDQAKLFADPDADRLILVYSDTLLEVDVATGDRTVLAFPGDTVDLGGALAWNAPSNTLFSSRDALIAHDIDSQTSVTVATYPFRRLDAIAVEDGASTLLQAQHSGVYRIDRATGAEAPVATRSFVDDSSEFFYPAVPVADTLWLGRWDGVKEDLVALDFESQTPVIVASDRSVRSMARTADAVYEIGRYREIRRHTIADGTMQTLVPRDHPDGSLLGNRALAVDELGQRIYASSFNVIAVYDIAADTITSLVPAAATPPLDKFGLAFLDGTLYGIGSEGVMTIDTTTGDRTLILPMGVPDRGNLGVHTDGTLIIYNATSATLMFFDPTTQSMTRTIDLSPSISLIGAPVHDVVRDVIWLGGSFVDLTTETHAIFAR